MFFSRLSILLYMTNKERKMFHLVTSMEQRQTFCIPMRNRTSDLRIPRSDALSESHRDSMVSVVYYEVHMTRVLHTTRINNVDSVMFVDSLSHVRDKMKNIFLYFFTELKTYHLSYFHLMIYSYY